MAGRDAAGRADAAGAAAAEGEAASEDDAEEPLAAAAASRRRDPARIEALREWRRREAARRAVPAYVVLHDRTLAALAAARPSTLDALSEIPGIGPAKLEAYGKELLALLGARGAVVSRRRGRASSTRAGRVASVPAAAGRRTTAAARRTCAAPATRPFPRRVTAKLRLENRGLGQARDGRRRAAPQPRVLEALCREPQEGLRHRRRGGRRLDRAPGRPARAAAGAAREEGYAGEGMTATRVYLVRHGATGSRRRTASPARPTCRSRTSGATSSASSRSGWRESRSPRSTRARSAARWRRAASSREPHGRPVTPWTACARSRTAAGRARRAPRSRRSTRRNTPGGSRIRIRFAPRAARPASPSPRARCRRSSRSSRRTPASQVLVASHKATIRLMIGSLLGFDLRRYRDHLDQSPASLNILDFKDVGACAAVAVQRHVALLGLAVGDAVDSRRAALALVGSEGMSPERPGSALPARRPGSSTDSPSAAGRRLKPKSVA